MNNLNKKIQSLLALISAPLLVFGQGVEGNEPIWDFSPNVFDWSITFTALIVTVLAVVAIYRVTELMIRMKEIEIYEKEGIEKYLAEQEANKLPWWRRMMRKLNNAVPVAKEGEILMDHSYDGIKELDNNLPPWWLYGFYITIIFSIGYIVYHHFSPFGMSSQERYAVQMEKAQEEVDVYLSQKSDLVDETNVTLLMDAPSLEAGREIFVAQCAACHLESGGGSAISVGPNLTDEYWIHGGSIKDIFSTIKYGVPEKGMIAWKAQLSPADIHAVSSYVFNLQGTNPPDAKEPQGELYVRESVVEKSETADSTKVD